MPIEITEAEIKDMPFVRELMLEYARSLNFNLCFQGFDQELAELPGFYSRPEGCILIAKSSGQAVGCIALKKSDDQIGEMKRLYVKPDFQGQGLGRKLTNALILEAKAIGYKRIRLDTVPSMAAAIAMYNSMGFYAIAPYRENPVPGTAYLEKTL
jgi:putative acetyltransferase